MSGDDANGPDRPSTPWRPRGLTALEEVESYWRSLSRDGGPPPRSAIDSSRIGGALPHAFILQRVDAGAARLRFAGQALADHLGAEPRGMPLSVLFDTKSRPVLARHLDQVFDEPALIDVGIACPRNGGRLPTEGRLLLLPLTSAAGDVALALGALLLDGNAGRAPRRFIIPEGATVRSETIARRHALAAVTGAHRHHGLSEAARPWLRLVVSND